MPFEEATKVFMELTGAQVSQSTARRCTLETGEAAFEVERQEREQLQREFSESPQGAKRQVMSGDGAMVPLVGGAWAEVKTLVLADVSYDEQGELNLEQVSSISRLTDAETFATETLLEVHRKGLAKADEVCAVQDGAEWLQGLVDYHRSNALRVLDFPHAAEYVAEIGEMLSLAGVNLPKKWLKRQLHNLQQKGPQVLLTQLGQVLKRYSHIKGLANKISYLQKREGQMQYPEYQDAGWPIGSGMVESANKLVVEARLKGAGMHWDPENVNKMLVQRNAVCNGRFPEMWKKSRQQQKEQRKCIRQHHQKERYQVACYRLMRCFVSIQLSCPNAMARIIREHYPQKEALTTKQRNVRTNSTDPSSPSNTSDMLASSNSPSSLSHRPAANHPWRKPFMKHSPHPPVPLQEDGAKI
jgi:hypothetical protein